MLNFRLKPLVLSLSPLAFLSVAPVFAEQLNFEPVVVTASRFPDSIASSPIGARVISSEQIVESGAANVAEALNKLGGVHIRQDLFGGANPSIDLRGFGVTGDQNTLILIDGVRVSENELAAARLSGISLDSVEKIEILPGGGAVLYGSNATGGVINVITKAGGFNSRKAKISAAAGSFGTRDLRASGSLGGEQISLALNFQDYQSDNQRRNNQVEQQNFGGRLAFRRSDTDLVVNFGAERSRARLPGARTEQQWHNDPNGTSTPNDFANTNLWYAGLSATHKVGEFELAASLTRRERKTDFYSDYGFSTYSANQITVTMDEFSPRAKWLSRLADMDNELIVGYDWRTWDFESNRQEDFGFPGGVGPSFETGKQTTQGWYLQDNLQVTPSTLLSLGARSESLDMRRDVPYGLFMTPVDQKDLRTLHAWSFGAKQSLGVGWLAHARTGTSYRIANIDENRCYAVSCSLLQPQTSRDHELGLGWSTQLASASIVLFRSNLENELYFNRLAPGGGANVNMQPTRRQGLELAVSWKPTASLSLSGRYTWTDASFRSGVSSGIDLAGKTVPVVPRHRASLLANWAISPVDRLFLGANYVGSQQYDNDPANRFAKMPAYTTMDTKYSHAIGDATLSLAINNVFDKKYYSYAIVNNPTAPTTYNAYPDRGRSIMATVEYAFR